MSHVLMSFCSFGISELRVYIFTYLNLFFFLAVLSIGGKAYFNFVEY